MSFIAAILLLVLDDIYTAFIALASIMNRPSFQAFYSLDESEVSLDLLPFSNQIYPNYALHTFIVLASIMNQPSFQAFYLLDESEVSFDLLSFSNQIYPNYALDTFGVNNRNKLHLLK